MKLGCVFFVEKCSEACCGRNGAAFKGTTKSLKELMNAASSLGGHLAMCTPTAFITIAMFVSLYDLMPVSTALLRLLHTLC